jgi:hypothetical protein
VVYREVWRAFLLVPRSIEEPGERVIWREKARLAEV